MPGEPAVAPQSKAEYTVSPWCNSVWKRLFDICSALFLLVVLLPWMILIAVAVKLTSRGPVLFRQARPGRNGQEFVIVKFRTMVVREGPPGPALTWTADPRVTKVGRFLRKWKLDEFPQLLNILRGEMSFVGPRPLPPALWNSQMIEKEAECVLSVRPGITGQAALEFRNEEKLFVPLASLTPEQAEAEYGRHIMPVKLAIELDYLRHASFLGDCRLIVKTLLRVFNPLRKGASDLRAPLPSLAQNAPGTAGSPDTERAATASPGD
jgi:lipopolysaccharide/colanic/teichoic acid biosynthesis glycosyltransferase